MANAKAVIVPCVDPRFYHAHYAEGKRLSEEVFNGPVEAPASAGSVSSLLVGDDFARGLLANIGGVAVDLHHVTNLVVIEHEGCGYYEAQAENGDERFAVTPETEKDVHARNARAASKIVLEKFPTITNAIFRYARLDGTIEDL